MDPGPIPTSLALVVRPLASPSRALRCRSRLGLTWVAEPPPGGTPFAAPVNAALDALVRCAQAGDQSAFYEVAETFRLPLVRYVRSIMRDPGVTEDIVQETLVIAWRHIGSVRDGQHLRPWLYRVARNQAVSAMRKRGRGLRARSLSFAEYDLDVPSDRRLASHGVSPHRQALEPDALPTSDAPIGDRAARSDLQTALRLAISRLPETYVAVVRLHYLHRCTTRETADLLSMKQSTVKMRLMRARELLGELLPEAIATIGGRAARELTDLVERKRGRS